MKEFLYLLAGSLDCGLIFFLPCSQRHQENNQMSVPKASMQSFLQLGGQLLTAVKKTVVLLVCFYWILDNNR